MGSEVFRKEAGAGRNSESFPIFPRPLLDPLLQGWKRMAAAHPLPVAGAGQHGAGDGQHGAGAGQHRTAGSGPQGVATAPEPEPGAEQGLVPVAESVEADAGLRLNKAVERLPVELDVTVPVREFRVRHLLALEPGQVIESQWNHGDDVPLTAGAVRLAWTEFEVIDEQLAVRVTRLP